MFSKALSINSIEVYEVFLWEIPREHSHVQFCIRELARCTFHCFANSLDVNKRNPKGQNYTIDVRITFYEKMFFCRGKPKPVVNRILPRVHKFRTKNNKQKYMISIPRKHTEKWKLKNCRDLVFTYSGIKT